MPNKVKYSPSGSEPALFKGNWAIDPSPANVGGGPSGTTGYYNGPTIPASGYAVFESGTARTVADDSGLIAYIAYKAEDATIDTLGEALDWVAGDSNTVVFNSNYENIVTNGLTRHVDAGFLPSYIGSGTTCYNNGSAGGTGTLRNGAAYSSSDGGYFTFDGSNDDIVLPASTSPSSSDPHTYAAWIYKTNATNGYFWVINNQDNSNGTGTGLIVYDNKIGYFWHGGASVRRGNASLAVNTWHHIAVTYDGSGSNGNYVFYRNGSVDISGSTISKTAGSLKLTWSGASCTPRIGSYAADLFYFPGRISMAQIYNRQLSAAEILQNYNATKARYGL